MALKFSLIENGDIFTSHFNPFTENNQIDFPPKEQIAVIYGPNGTGKTSFINAISGIGGAEVAFEYDGHGYTSGKDVFHVVSDQNNRNIIAGDTQDFLLGDNIKREFELQGLTDEKRTKFIGTVIDILKRYNIKAAKHPLIALIEDTNFSVFVKGCANSQQKGRQTSNEELDELMTGRSQEAVLEFDEDCLRFLIDDYGKRSPAIMQIEAIKLDELIQNPRVREIEENVAAINILDRFTKDQCIVCDTVGIDRESLLKSKKANREKIQNQLTPEVQEVLNEITGLPLSEDPFNIKQRLLNSIESGDILIIAQLINEFRLYKKIFAAILCNQIVEAYAQSGFAETFHEYQELVSNVPVIREEDYLFIKEIVSNSMSKELDVERDEKKRLRIKLANEEFLNQTREQLPLSSGEQNFLSLAFEFLKAKNSSFPIVIIDDPISSFDSIYKNKVVYSLVKVLANKKRIILTHNLDLVRLLNAQYSNCFKLYLLNNTEGEVNGFIPLLSREQDMLVSLEKLLNAFREDVPNSAKNSELFLISMIPFMRGYANIVNNRDIYQKLTQVMHGYKTESVDIAGAYAELFGNCNNALPKKCLISVPDILGKTVDNIEILDTKSFPLLNRTLKHSFQYLFLRLTVEKALVEKFVIDVTRKKQLGQIISAAFPDEDNTEQRKKRVSLMSKKTLINEFNHFEGNLSIFQPAIDITNQALRQEKDDVMNLVKELCKGEE